jgi:hypothetical protein
MTCSGFIVFGLQFLCSDSSIHQHAPILPSPRPLDRVRLPDEDNAQAISTPLQQWCILRYFQADAEEELREMIA